MKQIQIRQGNDKPLTLALTTLTGEVVDLRGVQNLSVTLQHNDCGGAFTPPYTISEEGAIMLEFNAPEQKLGDYHLRIEGDLPDDSFADGAQHIAYQMDYAVRIVPTGTPLNPNPYQPLSGILTALTRGERGEKGEKGEPFRFEDLTEEMKSELKGGGSNSVLPRPGFVGIGLLRVMLDNTRFESERVAPLIKAISEHYDPEFINNSVDIARFAFVRIIDSWLEYKEGQGLSNRPNSFYDELLAGIGYNGYDFEAEDFFIKEMEIHNDEIRRFTEDKIVPLLRPDNSLISDPSYLWTILGFIADYAVDTRLRGVD